MSLAKRKRPKREDKMIRTEKRLESDVFDRQSLFAIAKLMKDGHFATVDYPVAKGKEANIFCGTTTDGKKVAIKIYRIDTSNFIRMHDYIDGDPRFQGTSRKRFETILAWTRKEYSNLKAFHEAGVSVPRPIAFLRNVVVMEFFAEGNIAFSTLEQMGSENPQKDYDFMLTQVKKIYQAGFVHGDISEYNILVTDDGLKLLDCAQAVLLAHPRAEDFLRRDVENLVRYFKKQGVKEADTEKALAYIKDARPVLRGLEQLKYDEENKKE
ncbi:RIO-type serine/threonine-protein kinase Rio1 [uncultured archaeon]|nr:RIO-type serine/threonine-protein kinase Rio1 [uncultured archaeon]